MSADDGQLPMIDVCSICGAFGFVAMDTPTVEPQRRHAACFHADARWFDHRASLPPTPDARLRRRARQRWRLPRDDGPELRVVS